MPGIDKLLEQHGDVWFWVDKNYRTRFYSELSGMEARFANGEAVTPEGIGHCMGVHRNKSVGYVSNMVWYNTFFSPAAPVKVDYRKYTEGREDYMLAEPNLRPVAG